MKNEDMFRNFKKLLSQYVLRIDWVPSKVFQTTERGQVNTEIYDTVADKVCYYTQHNDILHSNEEFICWLIDVKDGENIKREEMRDLSQDWVNKAKGFWQLRGSSGVGFQVQHINRNGEDLAPDVVYTLEEGTTVRKEEYGESRPHSSMISYDDFKEEVMGELDRIFEIIKPQKVKTISPMSAAAELATPEVLASIKYRDKEEREANEKIYGEINGDD